MSKFKKKISSKSGNPNRSRSIAFFSHYMFCIMQLTPKTGNWGNISFQTRVCWMVILVNHLLVESGENGKPLLLWWEAGRPLPEATGVNRVQVVHAHTCILTFFQETNTHTHTHTHISYLQTIIFQSKNTHAQKNKFRRQQNTHKIKLLAQYLCVEHFKSPNKGRQMEHQQRLVKQSYFMSEHEMMVICG